MLLVLGKIMMQPEQMDRYEAAVKVMTPKVLEEQGCIYYSLTTEDKAAGVIAVAEMWDDEPALVTHLQQPWILQFVEQFGPHMTGSTVKIYDADNERDLPGS